MLRVLSLLVLVGTAALVLILLLDSYGVLTAPEDYRIAQQFSEADLSWRTPSVLCYALRNVGLAVILGSIAFLSLQHFRGKLRPAWGRVYAVVALLLVSVIVAGYLYWWQTGFDH
jgi:hypothetical protein